MSEYDEIVKGLRGPGQTGQHPKQREDPSEPPKANEAGNRAEVGSFPGLVRASDLIAEEDRDQGDFEPGDLYKGFKILGHGDWPDVRAHERLHRRFYVVSPEGTVGLVPWEGSQIVWPWEAAWQQDLHRSEVQSFLKDDRKERKSGR